VLATKPQMLDTAAPAVQAFIHPKTLLISILAGKTLGDLAAHLPNANAIIRAMPNRQLRASWDRWDFINTSVLNLHARSKPAWAETSVILLSEIPS